MLIWPPCQIQGMDTNKDGKLSVEEALADLEQWAEEEVEGEQGS